MPRKRDPRFLTTAPKKPPRGGRKIAGVRVLKVRNARPRQRTDAEREAA
jgi:hypothetical protein